MSSNSSSHEVFDAFLARVASGNVSPEDWNQHAVTHYREPEIEQARRELVRAALFSGQCSAQPVQGGLQEIALRLREMLAPDKSG